MDNRVRNYAFLMEPKIFSCTHVCNSDGCANFNNSNTYSAPSKVKTSYFHLIELY